MSYNKIKDTDFLFLTSMLRAREAKMLTADKLSRVLEASSYDEAVKLISDSGYPDMSGMSVTAIDDVLSTMRADAFHELESFKNAVNLLDIFRLKYDYHNIKVLVKSMAANTDSRHLLSDSGRVTAEVLIEAFISGDRLYLPKQMAETISRAVGILSRTSDPQLSDINVDRHYYQELTALSKTIGLPYVSEYIAHLIDSANLRTTVRTFRMKKDMDFLKNALFEGGHFRIDLILALSPNGEGLKELFDSSSLSKAAQLGQIAINGGSLTQFERVCDDAATFYLFRAKLISFGAEPVVHYIAALEAEIMSIRMILTGKRSGIGAVLIRERLRASYV